MNVKQCALHDEHAFLGAKFAQIDSDEGVLEIPAAYASPDEAEAIKTSCGLVDCSGMLTRLIHGPAATQLVETMCAGKRLQVGESAYEAELAGDGSLMSVSLVARTGDEEYGLWDISARSRLNAGWIDFVSTMEQGGFKPFAEAQVDKLDEKLLPLLLWGPSAPKVLGDYLHDGARLPERGHVANIMLDKIDCVVVGLPRIAGCWLVMVPLRMARVLWRSFLSFEEVQPVGRVALTSQLRERLSWFAALESGDQIKPEAKELRQQGLLRLDRDFIGARGLA